ncbi:MAG: ribulose-phosphate 3-epimerase [Candidatus Nephthysia bennettiae]|uniref:Ribulose-phosphate 3-epimerase n=1 Tax=Candidatus Nephthysia bennettiae TaxID=3127016 RepID=A0A934N437_9BACT|nr:ribulose-phosphate 3-epimerase [Candidatus Dormibacteraeota bacterium]MBJ7611293.1 ribulose-phosphate 3-epimerase [Candidatus Dormibacteraeota bacterium]PZR98818.1 MAG: ribulose-phosphate 3-epimerase [Candidatus Dormibacteraeota bacterium]
MIEVVASILSADLTRLGEQVREAQAAGAGRVQVDIMDGHFVPNLTFGPDTVAAVKRAAPDLPVEAHLMVERPEQFVAAFARAGADYILVQVESTYSLYRTVQSISEAGSRPGLVLNPATPVETLREIWRYVSMVNVMTVEPGFGGQRFIASSPDKIRRVCELAPGLDVEVDGGIDSESAPLVVAAGARLLVAGSSVFSYPEGVAAGIRALRESVV